MHRFKIAKHTSSRSSNHSHISTNSNQSK